jgi:thermostable 8-oxoguanine DNA glycosylase
MLTIQQWLALVPRALDDVRQHGAESRFAWGNKRAGIAYILAEQHGLHAKAQAYQRGGISLESLILEYLAIPGLGIVKASFLCQLTVGDGACLDIHNLRAMGLNEAAFKTPKTLKVESILKRIRAYNGAWSAIGDSAYWWNSWCDSYAARAQAKSPVKYSDGAAVSAAHLTIIRESE